MKDNVKNLLIVVLVATNLAAGGWLLYDKLYRDPFVNPYPFIDFSRNFIPQEHYIVNIQPLREELRSIAAREEKDYTIAIYFEYLNTGANIAINTDQSIWPASLAKVPLAMAVMNKVEDGAWRLDNELVLFEQDKDRGSGELFNNQSGSRFTIERLLRELLQNSDNTAYRIILRNMKSEELFPVLEELGLEKLFKPDGRVSAKEYSRIFRALYTSSFLKRENSQMILELLTNSSFRKFLSAGLPEQVAFAHKWGKNERFSVYLDAGIVYLPNRPYLLTVMIQVENGSGTEQEAKVTELMREISRKTYDYFKTQNND